MVVPMAPNMADRNKMIGKQKEGNKLSTNESRSSSTTSNDSKDSVAATDPMISPKNNLVENKNTPKVAEGLSSIIRDL